MSKVRSTPDALKVLAYFLATVLLGAAIAPHLHSLGKGIGSNLAEHGDSGFLGFLHRVLTESDFSRYFKRSMMLMALVCIWPTLRWLRASGPVGLGLKPNPDRWYHLFLGCAVASGLLLTMGVVFHQMGVYTPRNADTSAWTTAVLAAIGAGAIEELLFRGLIFALVLRTFRPLPALIFVTFLFAIVHFLNPPKEAYLADSEVVWSSGFWLVGETFKNFGDAQFLLAEFSTLFAVGWVLGVARLRTGSLWLPIGLHAGWIFGLKIFSAHFGATPELTQGDWLPWIGINIKIGIVPLAIVSFTGVLVAFLFKKTEPESSEPSSTRGEN